MKTIVYIHSTCRKTIQNAVRTKERVYNITGAIWNLLALLWNQKILLEGHVVGSNGKCTAVTALSTNSTTLKMCGNRSDATALAVKRRIVS